MRSGAAGVVTVVLPPARLEPPRVRVAAPLIMGKLRREASRPNGSARTAPRLQSQFINSPFLLEGHVGDRRAIFAFFPTHGITLDGQIEQYQEVESLSRALDFTRSLQFSHQ